MGINYPIRKNWLARISLQRVQNQPPSAQNAPTDKGSAVSASSAVF
jgi:hypothetical protein